jgi:choice-of-anchor B domain-containing protein
MRLTITAFFLLSYSSVFFAQNVNVTHKSTLTYTNQTLANLWGYAANGEEYALVGAKDGTSIVKVTNPSSPTEVAFVSGPSSSWREIKTYQNYAYVVTEGGTIGLQIIDLSNLPNSNPTVVTWKGDGVIAGLLNKAHALQVDEVKGYLYLYGTNLFGGRALTINIADPDNPTYAGYYNGIGYVHDGYANNDTLYAAQINAGSFSIVNMANKSNPVHIVTQTTPGVFTHNTWRYGDFIYTTDEVSNSFLTSYKFTNHTTLTQQDKIQSNPGSNSIVHNTYIRDGYAITSWYRDGFTIVDVSRPANMVQVGNYDTYPCCTGNGFNGCWGVYPYLPSGNILISNIAAQGTSNGELMVLTPTYVRGCYIEGKVKKSTDNTNLSGVLVQLLSTSTSETTNASGDYKMGQLNTGTYTLRASKTGYQTFETSVTLTTGTLITLNISLVPNGAPIDLVDFNIKTKGNTAELRWETATEINNEGFEVQQSKNGTDWMPVTFIKGKGNSQVSNFYEYSIPDLSAGDWYFRLKQVDFDGSTTFTAAQLARIDAPHFQLRVLGNPAMHIAKLDIYAEKERSVTLSIRDAGGVALVPDVVVEVQKGQNYLELPLDGIAAGLYQLTATYEGQNESWPLVVVK